MVKITCNACGRRYDYAKEGLCPNCGAYNRPPRRETVDANGEIHHLNITEEMTPPQGKVCYEAQECHEDAVRKVRPRKSGGYRKRSLPHEKIAAKASDYSGKKKKAQMIAIGAALLSVVTTLIGNLTAKSETVFPEPEGSIAQAEERAVEFGGSVETKDGRFSIVGWRTEGTQFEVHYIANFDPLEKGMIFVEYVKEDGQSDIMTPTESYFQRKIDGGYGLLTFEASTKGFEPQELCLEYRNETFWIDLT